MKKILLGVILSFIFADAKNVTYKEVQSYITLPNFVASKVMKSFSKDTGIDKDNPDLMQALKNKNFKHALYEIYFKKNKVKSAYGSVKYSAVMPDYPKSLEYLSSSLKDVPNNSLVAWQGLSILINNYMSAGVTPIAKKYIKVFAKPLKEKNICIGYYYLAKSNFAEYGAYNYSKAVNILKQGISSCKKKNIQPYILMYMKHLLSKARAMKRYELKLNSQKGN